MDKRTEFVEKLSAQMVEWDAQIDQLKEKAESATPEEKFEYSKAISALQLKREGRGKTARDIGRQRP